MGRSLFLFLIFVIPFEVLCQTDSLRAYYIQEFPDKFFVWPVLKQRQLSFEVRDKDEKKKKVDFTPNNSFALGMGFYIFELAFELTFAVPLNEKSREIYGESEAKDLQLNILAKKWIANVYHQKYSGFYMSDKRLSIPSGSPYPLRPDLVTRNYGISGMYVLNNRKFSLRSAYNFVDRQKESKGSWLVYGTINSFKMTADSAILRKPTQLELGAGADFKRLRYTTLSFAPGYSYNFVKNKFFVNGTLTAGPAHHWVYYLDDKGVERNDIDIRTTATLRLALGYNSDRLFGGIGFTSQSRIVTFENIRVSNSSNSFHLRVGYRFDEVGPLKKRVWDIFHLF